MSFLIKVQDSSLSNYLSYEREVIRCVANMNISWIESMGLENLCLGCLGVKYKDDGSLDNIEHITDMIVKGYGKCDSIVAWFMAMYTLAGIKTEPLLVSRGSHGFHAQMKVYEGNGVKIIDPSVNLKKINKEMCGVCK